MKVPFVKMSGAGNDLILVDHRRSTLRGREPAFARFACHRRFGVGADGVVLIEPDDESDFRVRFFNPDGGEYALCGNGARCVPVFATELGFAGPDFEFRSDSGRHVARVIEPGVASVRLAPVKEIRLDVRVDLDGEEARMDWGDIGVPHGAVWVEDVASVPIERWGPQLRSHAAFAPDGTNVSFVERRGAGKLRIRTFERGVEGETWACGSGSAVVATIARERGWAGELVELEVRGGGVLRLTLGERGTPPELEGPVSRICEGTIELPEEIDPIP